MTLLYSDPRFLDHDTRRGHPERAERLRQITEHLDATGLSARCAKVAWQPAERAQIERVHEAAYVAAIEDLAARGGGRPEPDTVVSAASFDVARLAAGAACDAVERVLNGEDRTALCIIRPPGHHALPDRAMGFCLFNNVAIAARAAIDEHGLERVLVVDWDVHHGNSTQDVFYADGRVGFFSIHRWPFYPGTGAADETGTGAGLGAIRNLPVEFGTPRGAYREQFRRNLEELAARIRPQLVLVSAGFDSHREDPIGSLGLEAEDFADLTKYVLDVANVHAGGRVVSLLEGGYNPQRLAECVATHLHGLLGDPAAQDKH
jgi:acetoin utilization deacetylase AcuC-like enzyme